MAFKVKIVDLGMDVFVEHLKLLKLKPKVQVGVFSDIKQRKLNKGNIDNVGLMAIHEFGVPNNPTGSGRKAGRNHTVSISQRSILRSTTKEKEKDAMKLVLKEYDRIIKGQTTFENTFKLLGVFIEGAMKLKFTDGTLAPNAPSTIKKKGSSRPLIDEGQLRQAMTNKVIMK